ncbi:ead/Ea22-like family protein [Salmonella enterica]|nr:ead/Ea22-like family protein [Salmonella enterica]
MTIDKQVLRERYSPKPVPKCHICGEEMTIQRISASRITYGCTGATYDDKGCHYAEGRSIADDHYEQSRVTVVDVSDPDVLALLDELEAETGYREGAFIACNRWHDKFRETEDKLECAERRIAELEAKLETADKLQDSAFRDGLKAGFSYGQTDDQSGFAQCMSAYSTRTDIGVKVE